MAIVPASKRPLETALARKVTVGEIRFNLFTGPGFTVSDVVIGEDPALGAEPIAYVGELQAAPRLWSLVTGHLVFSLFAWKKDTYLNLSRVDVRNGEYRWNFETLLRPAVVATFPHISLRGARINFKAGNVKSMVYLLDSDLDVTPPSSRGVNLGDSGSRDNRHAPTAQRAVLAPYAPAVIGAQERSTSICNWKAVSSET